jgi:hypothetical protein
VQLQKPSSGMMKLALKRTATGKEDPELPLPNRISSLELPALEIVAQNRVQVTETSQHQLLKGDCGNQAFIVKLLKTKTTKGHQ